MCESFDATYEITLGEAENSSGQEKRGKCPKCPVRCIVSVSKKQGSKVITQKSEGLCGETNEAPFPSPKVLFRHS